MKGREIRDKVRETLGETRSQFDQSNPLSNAIEEEETEAERANFSQRRPFICSYADALVCSGTVSSRISYTERRPGRKVQAIREVPPLLGYDELINPPERRKHA